MAWLALRSSHRHATARVQGVAAGMNFKFNTAALLVTRGCSEMKKLSIALGGQVCGSEHRGAHLTANDRAQATALSGLSGIGDLMLTCFGPASRNRSGACPAWLARCALPGGDT
jgi:glycerol-3-phosphate dehydrogenase